MKYEAKRGKMGRRKRVTAVVETDKGIVLVSHSKYGKPNFMLPGGSIRKNESYMGAVTRELYEETGLHAYEVKYLFDLPTKKNLHKVFFVKTHGDLRKRHETTHIDFWNESTKDNLEVAWHVKPIINRYKNHFVKTFEGPTTKKEPVKIKESQDSIFRDTHKKRHKYRKYSIWQTIRYKCRKAGIPLWFILCFIAMFLVALIHQIQEIKAALIDLSVIFYILEAIVIGYIAFWLLKKFDRIRVYNNMRLFGLRILSGIFSAIGVCLIFIFLIVGMPVVLNGSTSMKEFYGFMGLGSIYSLFSFGADFGLPLAGIIIYLGIILSLALIGGYLFFKFQRKTGRFVWFGRI